GDAQRTAEAFAQLFDPKRKLAVFRDPAALQLAQTLVVDEAGRRDPAREQKLLAQLDGLRARVHLKALPQVEMMLVAVRRAAVDRHLVGSGSEVPADDVLDEMLDEFAADVARLGAGQVGPILLRRVRVSDNVNPAYAAVVEARLAAAVFRSANVALVRCVECNSTRSRVDGAEWVVTRGITTREEAQSIARKYGA